MVSRRKGEVGNESLPSPWKANSCVNPKRVALALDSQ